MDRLLTWDEAAERLNTTPRHVRRLVFERRIAYRKLGRYVRFHPDDLEEYITAQPGGGRWRLRGPDQWWSCGVGGRERWATWRT